jgi:methanesulfonate monooxygenase subunit beta
LLRNNEPFRGADRSSRGVLNFSANRRRVGANLAARFIVEQLNWGSPVDAAALVRDTIYRSTILLDRQDWNEWLAHCDDEFQYAIRAWSPEINRDVTYLALDRQGLASMIKLLPKHNTDHSPLTRHTSVYTVDVDDQAHSAKAVSSVIVYQNLLDGINSHIDAGESRLFLVGKYIDTFKIENNKAKFVSREVRIENRRLDKGSHWPI